MNECNGNCFSIIFLGLLHKVLVYFPLPLVPYEFKSVVGIHNLQCLSRIVCHVTIESFNSLFCVNVYDIIMITCKF